MKTNAITNENDGNNPDAALRQKIEERAYITSGLGTAAGTVIMSVTGYRRKGN